MIMLKYTCEADPANFNPKTPLSENALLKL